MSEKYDQYIEANHPASIALEQRMNDKFKKLIQSNQDFSKYKSRIEDLSQIESRELGIVKNGRNYYTKNIPGDEQDKLYIQVAGLERVIFDPVVYDPTALSSLSEWGLNNKGDILYLMVTSGGDELDQLLLLNSLTGSILEVGPSNLYGTDIFWNPTDTGFYYVNYTNKKEKYLENRELFFHQLGTSYSKDISIFGKDLDKRTVLEVDSSENGDLLTIQAYLGLEFRCDLYLARVQDKPELDFVKISSRDINAETEPYVLNENTLLISSTYDAPMGSIRKFEISKLLSGEIAFPGIEDNIFIDEDPEEQLISYAADPLTNSLALLYSKNTLSNVQVVDLTTGEPKYKINLPFQGVVTEFRVLKERPGTLYYGVTNLTRPETIYEHDLAQGTFKIFYTPHFEPISEKIIFKQVNYTSYDGQVVTANLLLPADFDGSKPMPTIIYGYGGFSVSLTPSFDSDAIAWVEKGNIWAYPHLRGGSEQGENWHKEGMRDKKQNTFNDLYAFVEFMIENGYSKRTSIGLWGGSNGGLLAGAAITQRPELFKAVISEAALLDMLNFHEYGLGDTWLDEYGDPRIPTERLWLEKYSPFHNIKVDEQYPITLVANFKNDSRVDTMHGRKFAAKLEELALNKDDIYLYTEEDAGHTSTNFTKSVELSSTYLGFFETQLSK